MRTGKGAGYKYKRVGYLIDKAETILKNIEKLKEEHREELQK